MYSTGALAPWAVCCWFGWASVAPVSAGGQRCARLSFGGSITPPVQVCCGKAALSVVELCWAVVLVRQFTCDLRETVTSDAGHRGESARGIGYLSRPQRREFSDLNGDLR